VEPRKRNLQNYVAPSGTDCFQQWLRGVRDQMARQAIRIRLNRVESGNFGDCRALGDGVYELRINLGPGYRIYFGQDGDDVVLLGGGDKDTQERDIKIVKQRWSEHNAEENETL
jgi:putative addiction module killer protein